MDNQYKGMTVNERLYLSGLMEEFDKAVERRDVDMVISILNKVEITDDILIQPILRQLRLKE